MSPADFSCGRHPPSAPPAEPGLWLCPSAITSRPRHELDRRRQKQAGVSMAERGTWPQPEGKGLWGQGSSARQTAFTSLLHVKRLSGLWEVKSHQTCCLWSRSPQQPGARFAHPPAPHFMVGEAKAERGKNSQFAANAHLVFEIFFLDSCS